MSNEELEYFLAHHGVKGMKWGVRKKSSGKVSGAKARYNSVRNYEGKTLELKTKSGESITVVEGKKPRISAILSALSPRIHEGVLNSTSVSLMADGKKIGDADFTFQGKNKEELYLNMIQIDSKQRGKGYASTCMDAAVELGRAEGAKRITLDVPDNAPDARHIYEKLGFRQSGPPETSPDIEAMWGGGLTPMKLDISPETLKHSDPDYNDVSDEDLEKAFDQHYHGLLLVGEDDEMQQMDTDDFLAHYGIKGMKWGRRRTDAQLARESGSSGSSDSDSGSDKPKRQINKKHVAIAAGILGAAAAVTVTAVVASNQKKAGEAAVAAQMQAFAKKSVWELASQPAKPSAKPAKKPEKSAYSNRAKKKDTKMYGEKAARRIEKKVSRGHTVSSARQQEALRKYGGTAAKIAFNVGTAKARENAQDRVNMYQNRFRR